jgi:hypothetical protein
MVDFVAGTKTIFNQSSAPTGWTKDTTNDDFTLRVVSGTGGGTGGSVNFTSCMVSQPFTGTVSNDLTGTTGATTLDTTMIPSHTHTYRFLAFRATYTATQALPSPTGGINTMASGTTPSSVGINFDPTGGGGGHSHPVNASFSFVGNNIDFSVNYLDFIVSSKN